VVCVALPFFLDHAGLVFDLADNDYTGGVMTPADKRARELSLRVYKKPKKSAGCVITPKRTDIEIIEAQRAYCLRKVRYGR